MIYIEKIVKLSTSIYFLVKKWFKLVFLKTWGVNINNPTTFQNNWENPTKKKTSENVYAKPVFDKIHLITK